MFPHRQRGPVKKGVSFDEVCQPRKQFCSPPLNLAPGALTRPLLRLRDGSCRRARDARIPWQVHLSQGRHDTPDAGPGDVQENRGHVGLLNYRAQYAPHTIATPDISVRPGHAAESRGPLAAFQLG